MRIIQELQTAANQYADVWLKDETLFFALMDAEQKKYNAKEWYVITLLAQTYVNVKTGMITRKQGLEAQKIIPIHADMYIR